MGRTLLCEVVTPERIVYTNEVEMVVAPTIDGEIGILPLHAPLVGALKAGEVRVKFGDTTEWFAISGGYIQVHEDKVIILADQAAVASQIDVERVKQSLSLAEAELATVKAAGGDVDAFERDLKWCQVQLDVGSTRR
ncbi:MAG: ATP synthase F1 subunit epsilon [Coriobacteriia bacterium]|nr:ATP synthase F1 subunit epsilon [Coriobacteriia bacterium]